MLGWFKQFVHSDLHITSLLFNVRYRVAGGVVGRVQSKLPQLGYLAPLPTRSPHHIAFSAHLWCLNI